MTDPYCPKCNKRMDRGFLPDRGDNNVVQLARWMPGAPVQSFWTGIKAPKAELIPVATYRCPSCGLLESYARPEFDPKASARQD
jgi:hypothetical protein